jgi:hypothetical protein
MSAPSTDGANSLGFASFLLKTVARWDLRRFNWTTNLLRKFYRRPANESNHPQYPNSKFRPG